MQQHGLPNGRLQWKRQLRDMKAKIKQLLQDFQLEQQKARDSFIIRRIETKSFNSTNFLFLSTRLARKYYSNLQEAKLIMFYKMKI